MQQQLDFYNTNKTAVAELPKRRGNAMSQQDALLDIFKTYPNSKFTPSRLQTAYFRFWPITSIRRAITNLTRNGYLTKLNETVKGPYGANEHQWTYSPACTAARPCGSTFH